MTRFILSEILILIVICSGCIKDDFSPSDAIIGRWELTAIERKDTLFFNTRYQVGYIALEINFDENPLSICYDTSGDFRWHTDLPFTRIESHTEEIYNLTFWMDISSDGTIVITEEYQDLNSKPLQSWQYSSTWGRTEKGIENYEFYFQLDEPFTNLHPSKIFPLDLILIVDDEDIEQHSFKAYRSDYLESTTNSIFIYSFKKS
jgi:hypothetical protein